MMAAMIMVGLALGWAFGGAQKHKETASQVVIGFGILAWAYLMVTGCLS